MSSGPRLPPQFTFGGRVPAAVGLVIAVTVALSLVVVFGDRHAGAIFDLIALRPAAVYRGEVWRLLPWAFVEPSPLGLIFQCLFLYWFGRDLLEVWGSRRFLLIYGGIGLVAALATCLVAWIDPAVRDQSYMGGWPLTAAITVAWGLYFPERVIRIYFILPIKGYVLTWLTVGLTIVFAIYSGWDRFVPELCAEAAMLAFLLRGKLLRRLHVAEIAWGERRKATLRKAQQKERAKKRAASAAYLRVVEKGDDDPPDLPPDVDRKLDELLKGGSKRQPEN